MLLRLCLSLLLAAGALASGGCVAEPRMAVIPGGRTTGAFVLKHVMQDAAAVQRQADLQFQSTMTQAAQIVNQDPIVFAASYPALVPEFQRCEAQAALARQLLQKADAESSYAPTAVQGQYSLASAAMHASQDTMDSLLEFCRTQMLYMKQNPQVAGTSALRTWSRNLRSETKNLHKQVGKSTAKAEEMARTL